MDSCPRLLADRHSAWTFLRRFAVIRNKSTDGQPSQYTAIGVAVGAGVGTTIGVLIGGWAIGIGIALGAGVGAAIGAAMDAQQGHAAR
jgi:hypothetical protein